MLQLPGSRQHVAAAFEKVKAYLRPRQADGMTEFHIVVFCKSGKHTSVALAVLLDYVLSRAGYCTRVEHLCRAKWSLWSCGRRYSCQECDESHSSKTASRLWAEANAWTMCSGRARSLAMERLLCPFKWCTEFIRGFSEGIPNRLTDGNEALVV